MTTSTPPIDTPGSGAETQAPARVNGVTVPCQPGSRILQVIRDAGADVPTLCYDERVGPKGTCRACLVEVEVDGRKQTVASCTAYAEPGMKVETHTQELREYRKTLLELVLSEIRPLEKDDPRKMLGGYELWDAVEEYGARHDAFRPLPKRDPADDPNPFIGRDYDLCIACYRCTNICHEWEQADAITVGGRGQESRIETHFNNRLMESPCTFCGQCVNTCPTGALTNKKLIEAMSANGNGTHREPREVDAQDGGRGDGVILRQAQDEGVGAQDTGVAAQDEGVGAQYEGVGAPDECYGSTEDEGAASQDAGSASREPAPADSVQRADTQGQPGESPNGHAKVERTNTICPYCGVGCGIELVTRDGELAGAQPDFSAPSRGSLCVKGQFGSWDFVKSEERLKTPLIRGEDGELQPASWEEAFRHVTDRFKYYRDTYGPDSMVFWSSARTTSESNYLMQKFARAAIGTNNIDNCSRT